ncbi:MAG: molybdenum ABC transporter ATP-binding protein, partial [Pseudomonadota bacterium]
MTLSVALTHRLGEFSLDVAFEAPAGVTALFGRSGAGKTSIVNAVAGLLRPDTGRISADGETLLDTESGVDLPPSRRRIGYVFQEARLFPHMTVRQNLLYGRWFQRGSSHLGEVADLLGVGDLLDRRPDGLSGGERQRIAIGRALLSDPRLLLMDEPLASLDAARKAEIIPYLERLAHETRLPILYVSHSISEVARLASTMVVIEKGRVACSGPTADVLSDPDAVPLMGVREAGAVLTARVARHHDDGLTELSISAGSLFLPRIAAPMGAAIRGRKSEPALIESSVN